MMERWFISDLHLGHEKLLESRGFANIADHDAAIIEGIRSRVKQTDRLYVLGDVSVAGPRKAECFLKLGSIDCEKILIGGNHDPGDMDLISGVFSKVFGAWVDGTSQWLLTHIPVHESCLAERFVANLHGHTHTRNLDDRRYVNLSVEQTNYRPLHLDEIKSLLADRLAAAS